MKIFLTGDKSLIDGRPNILVTFFQFFDYTDVQRFGQPSAQGVNQGSTILRITVQSEQARFISVWV